MDKNIKLACFFLGITMLSLLAVVFSHIENELFLGLEIITQEELEELVAEKPQVWSPENAGEYICFQGNSIPFDVERNRFYLEADGYSKITVTSNAKNTNLYLIDDGQEYFGDVEQSIVHATIYRILIDTPEAVSITNLVLTKMPMIRIEVQAITGTGDVYNPIILNSISTKEKDVVGISNKTISAWAKENENTHTITIKTASRDFTKRKKVSLCSLGKYDAYHLYPISDISTGYRMKGGYWTYNQLNSLDEYDVPTEFVELFIGDYYRGLYLMTPRTDNDFYEVEDRDYRKTEDERDADGYAFRTLYQQNVPDNLPEYMLYIQSVYAYDNIFDDVIIVKKEGNEFFFPGGFRYTLGVLPGRYRWRGYNFANRPIQAGDYEVPENEDAYDETMRWLWADARNRVLSDGSVYQCSSEITDELWESGYYARTLLTEAAEPADISIDGLKAYEATYNSSVLSRFYYLDGY